MSTLLFTRSSHTLELIPSAVSDDTVAFEAPPLSPQVFDAYNNVDSHSHGPWPDGDYEFVFYNPHVGSGPDSDFGAHGIFIFNVEGRMGMGVHSGRQEVADGLGRLGPEHCTMGCIRTTDDGTLAVLKLHATDPLTAITVQS